MKTNKDILPNINDLESEWECYKCKEVNGQSNKRCKSCSAWRGGKRDHAINSSRNIDDQRHQKIKWTCEFCQWHNEESVDICAMCHESASQLEIYSNCKLPVVTNFGTQVVKKRKGPSTRNQNNLSDSPPLEHSWECHKCMQLNQSKNKRCKNCSSWKNGKRTFRNNHL
mmetsp:Transcript_23340/g.32827  ORF Transcript_23340/g.32827 Transcript_23340/m.32827 type:complete len:169 (+) Transcript_23340:1773-2279(+)